MSGSLLHTLFLLTDTIVAPTVQQRKRSFPRTRGWEAARPASAAGRVAPDRAAPFLSGSFTPDSAPVPTKTAMNENDSAPVLELTVWCGRQKFMASIHTRLQTVINP